jgi:cytoplasmic iron level regulating protein YaaA (DUF328/UPF0246 family)
MLILLPPSEGKTAPGGGEPVDLDSLAFAPALSRRRGRLLDALERLPKASNRKALEMLAISPGQVGEIAIDAELRCAPAAPAAEVYSGVLYDRLDLGGLSVIARRRADSQVLIASALWGFVRPQDRIPYYRLSAKARLKRIGPLAAFWRPALIEALPDQPGELVIDMRSGAYAAAWRPRRATLLAVRAFTEADGQRKAVSHMAKAVRGDVARALLLAAKVPTEPSSALSIVREAGFSAELGPGSLDVLVSP